MTNKNIRCYKILQLFWTTVIGWTIIDICWSSILRTQKNSSWDSTQMKFKYKKYSKECNNYFFNEILGFWIMALQKHLLSYDSIHYTVSLYILSWVIVFYIFSALHFSFFFISFTLSIRGRFQKCSEILSNHIYFYFNVRFNI